MTVSANWQAVDSENLTPLENLNSFHTIWRPFDRWL